MPNGDERPMPYPIQANANPSLAYRLAWEMGRAGHDRRAVGGVSRGQQRRGASRADGAVGLARLDH